MESDITQICGCQNCWVMCAVRGFVCCRIARVLVLCCPIVAVRVSSHSSVLSPAAHIRTRRMPRRTRGSTQSSPSRSRAPSLLPARRPTLPGWLQEEEEEEEAQMLGEVCVCV